MTKDDEPANPPVTAISDKKDFWQNLIRERFDKLYWQVSGWIVVASRALRVAGKTYNL